MWSASGVLAASPVARPLAQMRDGKNKHRLLFAPVDDREPETDRPELSEAASARVHRRREMSVTVRRTSAENNRPRPCTRDS